MAVSKNRIVKRCPLCNQPVNKDDPNTWKQVRGWVGGPRKDSMRLREDTGYFAHDECVAKEQSGQAVDQQPLPWNNPDHDIMGDIRSCVEEARGDIDKLEELLDEKD